MNIPDQLRRVVCVVGVFVLIWKWQDWRRAANEESAVAWMIGELKKWDATRDPAVRDRLREQMESGMKDVHDPADLVRVLPAHDFDTFVANESFEAWWATDPNGLLAWMAAQAEPPKLQVVRYLRELAKDPEKASSYVETLPAGAWREKVLETLVQDNIFSVRPQAAIALLDRMPEGETRTALLESALFAWSEEDFDGVVGWLDLVRDDASKRSFLAPIALGRAASDQCAALSWLTRLDLPVESVAPVARSIIDRWVTERSPAEASAAVAELPAGAIREAVLKELLRAWSQLDPRAAVEWISRLPQDDLRSQADHFSPVHRGR